MKRIITLILVLTICASCAISVLSAEIESELTTLDRQKDIVIWVSWDTEKPSVVFLAPNGAEYDPSKASATTTTIENESSLYYVIMGADAGAWKVRLDKGKNNAVDISVHDYNAGIHIESFTIGAVNEDTIPVAFLVNGNDNQVYHYRISAMIDHSGVEKELRSGNTLVGEEVKFNVGLSSLSTYGAYLLKLYVWYEDNGTDIFDFAFSDTFAYKNEFADEKSTDFHLTVEPENSLVTVEWEKLSYNADSVLVAMFENDGAEPVVFDEYGVNDGPIELSYDPASTSVSVEVTVKHNGVNSAPVRKTAHLDKGMPVSIPDGDLFNSLQLPMTYKGAVGLEADIIINDKTTKLILDGDGNVNLKLEDAWNNVSIKYTDGNSITWLIERDIYIDRMSPVINMSRSYDGMTVSDDSLIISGTVVDCSRITVNGSEVTVDSDGAFSKEVGLSDGENIIKVVASDGAGNESVYTALVNRGTSEAGVEISNGNEAEPNEPDKWYTTLVSKGSYIVLLISSVLCILVLGYALVFWRKDRKAQKKDKKKVAENSKDEK